MPSDLQTVLQLLLERYEMNDDALTSHIRDNFSGSLLSLKQLEPFIREILRRFKCLPRKKGVDGTCPSIAGYRTFNDVPEKCRKCHKRKHKPTDHFFELDPKTIGNIGWCKGVLNKRDRTVRYMLAGGNNKRSKPEAESVSVLDADAILKYLNRRVSELDAVQRKSFAQKLSQVVTQLEKEPDNA